MLFLSWLLLTCYLFSLFFLWQIVLAIDKSFFPVSQLMINDLEFLLVALHLIQFFLEIRNPMISLLEI
jgi:hypothetical protein